MCRGGGVGGRWYRERWCMRRWCSGGGIFKPSGTHGIGDGRMRFGE